MVVLTVDRLGIKGGQSCELLELSNDKLKQQLVELIVHNGNISNYTSIWIWFNFLLSSRHFVPTLTLFWMNVTQSKIHISGNIRSNSGIRYLFFEIFTLLMNVNDWDWFRRINLQKCFLLLSVMFDKNTWNSGSKCHVRAVLHKSLLPSCTVGFIYLFIQIYYIFDKLLKKNQGWKICCRMYVWQSGEVK